MPRSILVLWPDAPRSDTTALAATALDAAPERRPTAVLIAGGEEPETIADARLDNADELRAKLGLSTETDEAGVMDAAWAKWGDRFTDHMAGDFAWARWDPRDQELLLVRDHMGMRPLMHARYRDGFAAATDIRSLRSLPGVDIREDDLFVAMYLTDVFVDSERTIHEGIRRLPPGHLMHVRNGGRSARIRRYWQLSCRELLLPTDADYLELFRHTFLAAVLTRIPGDGKVATELSGGLDSTVVTAAVAQGSASQPLLALAASFAEFDDRDTIDEGRHRAWARSDSRIELLEVPANGVVTPEAIDRLLTVGGVPLAQVMELVRLRLWSIARERGISVVLDGFDGDTSINYGFERLTGLLLRGHVATLAREIRSSYRVAGANGVREAAILMAYPTYHRLRGRVRLPRMVETSVASRRLLVESGFIDRLRGLERAPPGDVRRDHILELVSGDTAMSIERCEIAAAAAGVEIRHPFFDRRLVELAVSLPPRMLFRDRMPRWIERRALTGLGPPEVLWRHDKGGMPGEMSSRALEVMGVASGASRLTHGSTGWIDEAALSTTRRRWLTTRSTGDSYALYPAGVLARWAAMQGRGFATNS